MKDKEARLELTDCYTALRLEDLIDWAKEQQRSPDLRTVLEWLEADRRPDWSEVATTGPSLKGLWSQWKGLLLCDGVVWRR